MTIHIDFHLFFYLSVFAVLCLFIILALNKKEYNRGYSDAMEDKMNNEFLNHLIDNK